MVDYTKVKVEREILTDAWFIVKDHVGIESRADAGDEWEQLRIQCQALYDKPGSEAQGVLAKEIVAALMDYYGELCPVEGNTDGDQR